MKYLLSLSMFVAVLLLTPAIAVGQTVYTMCDIWYDDSTNTVAAYAVISGDSSISSFYSPVIVVQIEANGVILASSSEVGSYGSVYTSTPAQPNTDYLVQGMAVLLEYYFYNYCDYDPIACYYMYLNFYPNYYDPFNFAEWGNYCNTFGANACCGEGPPLYNLGVTAVPGGISWDTVHVPPCGDVRDTLAQEYIDYT